MKNITLETIHNDLKFVKKELMVIKENIVDIDTVLTEEDIESLQEAERDLRERKTKKLT